MVDEKPSPDNHEARDQQPAVPTIAGPTYYGAHKKF